MGQRTFVSSCAHLARADCTYTRAFTAERSRTELRPRYPASAGCHALTPRAFCSARQVSTAPFSGGPPSTVQPTTYWTRSPGWRPGSLRFKPVCAPVRLSAPPLPPQRAAYSLLPPLAPVTPPSPPALNGPPDLCAATPRLLPSLLLLWGTTHALSHGTPSTLAPVSPL